MSQRSPPNVDRDVTGCFVCRSRKASPSSLLADPALRCPWSAIAHRPSPIATDTGVVHQQVRCDRASPTCRNCDQLGVRCPGYTEASSSASTHGPSTGDRHHPSRQSIQASLEDIYRASGVEKRRVGSCDECRRSKSRCSRTRPECRRCMRRGFVCSYGAKYDTLQPPSTLESAGARSSPLGVYEESTSISAAGGIVSAFASQSSSPPQPAACELAWYATSRTRSSARRLEG